MGCTSSSKQKTTSESKLPIQKDVTKEALELYRKQLGVGPEIYPESRVAPFSTLQTTVLKGAENYADYFSTPLSVGTPLFDETGTAIQGLLAGETGAKPLGAQDVEEYFKGRIYDPTMKTLREDVIPGIEESHAGPGFFGSARSHEISEAYKDTADWLGTQRSQLDWDVLQRNQALEEAKAGRTLATVPQAMSYGQVPAQEVRNNLEIAVSQIGGLSQIFGFGQTEQTQAQAELQDEIMRFAEENQITDPENLAIIMSLLDMNFSSSTSTSQGPGLGYAGLSGFFGGLGTGVGYGMTTPVT